MKETTAYITEYHSLFVGTLEVVDAHGGSCTSNVAKSIHLTDSSDSEWSFFPRLDILLSVQCAQRSRVCVCVLVELLLCCVGISPDASGARLFGFYQ